MVSFSQARFYLHQQVTGIKIFFVVFYMVGVAGLAVPVSYPYFKILIPFALLLSLFALAIFNKDYSKRAIVFFLLVYIAGFLLEVAGTKTHLIFGAYHYGEGLGIKVLETPLMIGLNWLLLVYLTASITGVMNWHPGVKIIVASMIMLGYDLVLEQVAPLLDMWYWHDGTVPARNYLSWFIVALLFHTMGRLFRVNMKNRLSGVIFISQLLFLFSLYIILKQ